MSLIGACLSTANFYLSKDIGASFFFFSNLPVPQWASMIPSIQLKMPPSRAISPRSLATGSNVQMGERGDMSPCFLLLRLWHLILLGFKCGTYVQQASWLAKLEGRVSSKSKTFKVHITTVNVMEDSKNSGQVNICACMINHFFYNVTSNEGIHNGLSLIPFLSEIPQISISLWNIPAILSYCIL